MTNALPQTSEESVFSILHLSPPLYLLYYILFYFRVKLYCG